MATLLRKLASVFPSPLRETIMINVFAAVQVPILSKCRPVVMRINDESITVKIPLTRTTKNHVGSLYFGVLAAGADVSGGLLAMHAAGDRADKIVPLFKDFSADFLRRAEGDVFFSCNDGMKVKAAVEEAFRTQQRVNIPLDIIATVPAIDDDPVATFKLTLSLKTKSSKTSKAEEKAGQPVEAAPTSS